jgi:hypothetical protein
MTPAATKTKPPANPVHPIPAESVDVGRVERFSARQVDAFLIFIGDQDQPMGDKFVELVAQGHKRRTIAVAVATAHNGGDLPPERADLVRNAYGLAYAGLRPDEPSADAEGAGDPIQQNANVVWNFDPFARADALHDPDTVTVLADRTLKIEDTRERS